MSRSKLALIISFEDNCINCYITQLTISVGCLKFNLSFKNNYLTIYRVKSKNRFFTLYWKVSSSFARISTLPSIQSKSVASSIGSSLQTVWGISDSVSRTKTLIEEMPRFCYLWVEKIYR